MKVTVMGLGLYPKGTGVEAVKFFVRRGDQITVTDLRSAEVLARSVKELRRYHHVIARSPDDSVGATKQSHKSRLVFVLGRHRSDDFKNADLVFQNPSVPADSPYLKIARKRRIPIVNDWSIFLSVHDPEIFVGVTGTRGKSTTTALIHAMLSRSSSYSLIRANKRITNREKPRKVWLAGNLGVSPLGFIDDYRGEPIVAELSSWLLHHFAGVKKSPTVAVVTNIMRDHLDKYKSMREYIADKENIFKFQPPPFIPPLIRGGKRRGGLREAPVVVLNWDDPIVRRMARRAKGRVVWFSLKKHLPRWVPLEKVKLLGDHNRANVLAACAAGEALGVPRREMIKVISTFRGLPDRLALVRTVGGVKYYNDTAATTPDATIAALRALGQIGVRPKGRRSTLSRGLQPHLILIAGGSDKKLMYGVLAREIVKYCKAIVFLPGTATKKLKNAITPKIHDRKILAENGFATVEAKSMREAVRKSRKLAVHGDLVLLSPGATSFGLFKNEFDRGEQFVRAVKSPRA